jgi:hypothetical protein
MHLKEFVALNLTKIVPGGVMSISLAGVQTDGLHMYILRTQEQNECL